jgi:hypothetical protein
LCNYYYFSEKYLLNGIRLFVFAFTFLLILIEILWNGVGAIQLYNSLTGIPIGITNGKGFSGVMLNALQLIVLVVATLTQLLLFFERRKLKKELGHLMSGNKVTKFGSSKIVD